ncbi:MAG: hypothetical protein AVDCRST_MAG05-3223, partial [uncultured Rubrobacteraceae bacterium]
VGTEHGQRPRIPGGRTGCEVPVALPVARPARNDGLGVLL